MKSGIKYFFGILIVSFIEFFLGITFLIITRFNLVFFENLNKWFYYREYGGIVALISVIVLIFFGVPYLFMGEKNRLNQVMFPTGTTYSKEYYRNAYMFTISFFGSVISITVSLSFIFLF